VADLCIIEFSQGERVLQQLVCGADVVEQLMCGADVLQQIVCGADVLQQLVCGSGAAPICTLRDFLENKT
jgi:hypothetical protein